jgi:ribosomal protein S18 acetylase RimI-like enzyme
MKPEIARAGPERIDALQPLWESLGRHHGAVAPELREALGPLRSDAESWAVRRALYEEWLAEPDAFVLIASGDGGDGNVGYALVHMRSGEETWATGDRIAELETLAVLPSHRGRGIGSALVEAVYEELRALDVGHLSVSVIASNADAVRFYERLGLTKFTVAYTGPVPPGSAS